MNSRERVQCVLEGKLPDRVPVCLHNFLHAARGAGVPLQQYRTVAGAAVQAHLWALERFGHDCIAIDLDTTMLAEAMGARASSAPDEPARIETPAIASLDEVDRLRPADPERDGRLPVLLEIVHLMAHETGREVSIRGNADQGPFSLASLLLGMQEFLLLLAEDPDDPRLQQLLEVCYQTHLATHRALQRAGAHFTSLGDSMSGPDVVSPAMFTRFARPFHQRLLCDLEAEGIFTVIHICGDTSAILEQLAAYPRCGFELDYKTDAARAKTTAGRGHVLVGNLDPSAVLARGSEADVRKATLALLEQWMPGGNFMLNAGCAIPATTPDRNLEVMVQTAHEAGWYQD